jgi:sterol desaturase/sphingolipid hydroxylase (fatty acid hydroxylase superfamily)
VDRSLRWLIPTPWMHWVHHSDRRAETDSNYSSLFSVWDRMFRTFRLRSNPASIKLGLDRLPPVESNRLPGMLVMPFVGYSRSEDTRTGPRRPDGSRGPFL